MTTIAFDGRYVAADTLGLCGETILLEEIIKLGTHRDLDLHFLHAITGNPAALGPWIRFHQGETKTPPKGDSNFIVFTKSCEWRMYSDESLDPMQHKDVHAWGSGYMYALGALDCGASATEAVDAAARRDPYTSIDYGIMVFDLVSWCYPFMLKNVFK